MSIVSSSELLTPESDIVLFFADTKLLITAHNSLSVWLEHYFLNKHSWLTITGS